MMRLFVVAVLFATVLSQPQYIEKCCDDEIGCFNNTPPFNKMPMPKCPDKIGVTMRMFTQQYKEKKESQFMTRDSIPAIWNAEDRTVFVTHGFMNGGNSGWLYEVKDALLAKGDFNVVIVGWGGGSQNPYYPYSATNVRTVGAEVALAAQKLMDVGDTTSSNLYCIGHGLGAHVCGHAGMRAHFGRVTGLDPAGPWFENEVLEVGLNPTSADFVDVIHTNGLPGLSMFHNIGTLRPMGHVDFYPNGGGSQPGCYIDVYSAGVPVEGIETEAAVKSQAEGASAGLVLVVGEDGYVKLMRGGDEEDSPMRGVGANCSHMRVIDLFLESIADVCQFTAVSSCTDHTEIPGSCSFCTEDCPNMGFTTEDSAGRGLYFLQTGRRKPYCQ